MRRHVFDQIRGLEAYAERDAQAVQRERFVEAPFQAVRGQEVEECDLLVPSL